MRSASRRRLNTRSRRCAARLGRLRRLAADAMLLQLHQHPAFQREQLLQTGNLRRSLHNRRANGRHGRQRRRRASDRRTARRLDRARPDVRTARSRSARNDGGCRRNFSRCRCGARHRTGGSRSGLTAGRRRARGGRRARRYRTRLNRRARRSSNGRGSLRGSTRAVRLPGSRLRCGTDRGACRSRCSGRSHRGRRTRRNSWAYARPRRCRGPSSIRSHDSRARRIQRRNRQHGPQPQPARIVRHKRTRIRVEQGLRGTRQRRPVVRLRCGNRRVVERLPRMNRVLTTGGERRRSGGRDARRVSSRCLSAGCTAGHAAQHKGNGSRGREPAHTAARDSAKGSVSNDHLDHGRVSAQPLFAVGLRQDFGSTQ